MGDIRNPKNIKGKSGSNEINFSFSYPDNKFQLDKLEIFEYKNKEIVIKKKNRHKHLDYGINHVSDGGCLNERFHERNQIKYEDTKRKNKTRHRINYECKVAEKKKEKTDLLESSNKNDDLTHSDEYYSEPELEMDFNDLFELSASVCEDTESDSEDN